eukprot:Awhi_evm2s3337
MTENNSAVNDFKPVDWFKNSILPDAWMKRETNSQSLPLNFGHIYPQQQNKSAPQNSNLQINHSSNIKQKWRNGSMTEFNSEFLCSFNLFPSDQEKENESSYKNHKEEIEFKPSHTNNIDEIDNNCKMELDGAKDGVDELKSKQIHREREVGPCNSMTINVDQGKYRAGKDEDNSEKETDNAKEMEDHNSCQGQKRRDIIKKQAQKNSCFQCSTTNTSLWRYNTNAMKVCNACYLYAKKYNKERPLKLNNRVVSRRLSKKSKELAEHNNNNNCSSATKETKKSETECDNSKSKAKKKKIKTNEKSEKSSDKKYNSKKKKAKDFQKNTSLDNDLNVIGLFGDKKTVNGSNIDSVKYNNNDNSIEDDEMIKNKDVFDKNTPHDRSKNINIGLHIVYDNDRHVLKNDDGNTFLSASAFPFTSLSETFKRYTNDTTTDSDGINSSSNYSKDNRNDGNSNKDIYDSYTTDANTSVSKSQSLTNISNLTSISKKTQLYQSKTKPLKKSKRRASCPYIVGVDLLNVAQQEMAINGNNIYTRDLSMNSAANNVITTTTTNNYNNRSTGNTNITNSNNNNDGTNTINYNQGVHSIYHFNNNRDKRKNSLPFTSSNLSATFPNQYQLLDVDHPENN